MRSCGPRTEAPGKELIKGRGYTNGMKTAISLPDELFEKVDRIAQRKGKSRSEVYREALTEYAAREDNAVTEAINAVVDELGPDAHLDDWGRAAARAAFERSEW